MKKILIMGANPETISLIQKAKELGLKTYVTDYNADSMAKRIADVPCNIDGTDVDGIVALVKQEKIDGVLVGVAEALIPAYCQVCEKLDYPCFASLDQFEIMIKKDKFKDTCRKYGVPVVSEFSLDDCESIVYPVVVKPVDSSSSKGVSICQNCGDLATAVEKALSFSNSKKIIIEKYMDGLEVISYYVVKDGEPMLVAMCDRYTNKEQEGVTQLPSAYIFPSKHLQGYINKTDASVKNMLKQMKIQNGVLFLQSFVDNDGTVKIYEPGFRLNGAQEHMIVSEITEIDAKELLIKYALSGNMGGTDVCKLADPTFHGMWACKLSPLVKEGIIGEIRGLEEIRRIDGVISVNPNYENGDMICGLGTQRQMAANIFLKASNKEELGNIIEKVNSLFDVLDEDGNSMLLTPFEKNVLYEQYA